MTSLYVDRAPQREIKLPLMTHRWDTVAKNTVPCSRSPSRFALVQGCVTYYFENLDRHKVSDEKCNRLSLQYLELVERLVRYGFYSSPAQLNAAIRPLLAALDSRQDVISATSTLRKYIRTNTAFGGFKKNKEKKKAAAPKRRRSFTKSVTRRLSSVVGYKVQVDEDEDEDEDGQFPAVPA